MLWDRVLCLWLTWIAMDLRVYSIFYFKPFSTVCHEVLLEKLNYGLDEPLFGGAQRPERAESSRHDLRHRRLWTSGNSFSLWGWLSTGCLRRLWSSPPWRPDPRLTGLGGPARAGKLDQMTHHPQLFCLLPSSKKGYKDIIIPVFLLY